MQYTVRAVTNIDGKVEINDIGTSSLSAAKSVAFDCRQAQELLGLRGVTAILTVRDEETFDAPATYDIVREGPVSLVYVSLREFALRERDVPESQWTKVYC